MTQSLYRYLPFERFYQMLINQELVLVSPKKWDDSFEQYWLKWLATDDGAKGLATLVKKRHTKSTDAERKVGEFIEQLYNHTFCVCFSLLKNAEVLWNARSDNHHCIMFATNEDRIDTIIGDKASHTVKEVHYDLENYCNPQSFFQKISIRRSATGFFDQDDLFLHKRECFSYEKEARLIAYQWESSVSDGKKNPDIIRFSIASLPDFIEGVMVHPAAEKSFVDLINLLCQQYSIPFWGKSNIYEFMPISPA